MRARESFTQSQRFTSQINAELSNVDLNLSLVLKQFMLNGQAKNLYKYFGTTIISKVRIPTFRCKKTDVTAR